jgi:hypothetical protein
MSNQVILEVEAAVQGRAIQARSLRHVPLNENRRHLVLFQYAGNPFSVLGMAFGAPGPAPELLVVCPDPLDRVAVAASLTPIRDALLDWFGSFPTTATQKGPWTNYDAAAAPQLLVPGAGVITALDNLLYLWRYAGVDDEWKRLGTELWALAEIARQPGATPVLPLAEALDTHWAFGLSTLETHKLGATVALCDAAAVGRALRPEELLAAERLEVGPLGQPAEIDNPVWAENGIARREGRDPRPVAAVTVALNRAWDIAVRADLHLASLAQAPYLTRVEAGVAKDWAKLIGPHRDGSQYARRRLTLTLAQSARELAAREQQLAESEAQAALADPMVAAERVNLGRATCATISVAHVRVGRRDTATVTARSDVPADAPIQIGAIVQFAGTEVRGVVTDLRDRPNLRWEYEIVVDTAISKQCSGTRALPSKLHDGRTWIVAVPSKLPPPVSAPRTSPMTHPNATGASAGSSGGGSGA